MGTDDVHAPFAQHLGRLWCEAIERLLVLGVCVGFKPSVAEHCIQELHPGYAGEMVVASAGLAYGGVASDLAPCL